MGVLPNSLIMKPIHIHSRVTDNGVDIRFREASYPIVYPTSVWEATPKETQTALKDNLALVTTMHLPLVLDASSIVYNSECPLLEPYFVQNFLKDIPSCSEVDGTCTDEMGNIPEFPSWTILPLFITATIVVTIYSKKTSRNIRQVTILFPSEFSRF